MKNNKVAILGDTHFGARGDSIEFHNYIRKFYENTFFPYLIDNNIKTVIQTGDLFDRRKFINFNTLSLVREYFFDKLRDNGMELYTILGNHCVYYKNTLDINSSCLLLSDYNNIKVFDRFTTIQINKLNVDMIPWVCDANDKDIFDSIKSSNSDICIGHFELDGYEMDTGNIFKGGTNKSFLDDYERVISGHFHHKSDDGHILYVGTPYEMTWHDYNDIRGFHVLDTTSKEIEFVSNPYKIFHKIVYDDSIQDKKYWNDYDYHLLSDCYVKLVAVNKTDSILLDAVITNIQNAKVLDLSIIDETFTNEIEDNDIDVDRSKDTLTLLNEYVDEKEFDMADYIKQILKELYIESLETERNS